MVTDGSPARKPTRLAPTIAFVGAILGATACFVGTTAELSALGRHHSAPSGVLIGIAIAFAVGAIILIRAAIQAEHIMRATLSTLPPTTLMSRRRPKNGPAARYMGVVLILIYFAIAIATTVSLHSAAVKSSETQHHGIDSAGHVVEVFHQSHTTRYDSWTTYNYDVQLTTATDGATATVLHDPSRNFQRYDVGQIAAVLVDPKDLNYAELPGEPVQSSKWVLAPIIFSAGFLLVGVALFVEQRKHRRMQSIDPAGVVRPDWS